MSNGKRVLIDRAEDVFGNTLTVPAPTPAPRVPSGMPRGLGESQFTHAEVLGDPVPPGQPSTGESSGDPANAHEEVISRDGMEAEEEFAEASPEQMSAESGEESAESDLHTVPGYQDREVGAESAGENGAVLRDAGSATESGQGEFFPILAALAPTLISTIGPAVAKGVMSRLSPRATKVIQAIPRPVVGAAAQGVAGVIRGQTGAASLLPLLAKLLEAAQKAPAGRESGMEVDEAFVEEAAAQIEVIIGTDDRIRIPATTLVPWRRYCALRITFPNGATYRGTGFFIGPRTVATAGHCVYLHNQGGWARKIEVIPAANGPLRPFGSANAISLRSVVGWVTGKKPECDYGCIVLPQGAFAGRNLGCFGFAAFTPAQLLAQNAVLAGYPGDKPFAELWGMSRKIKTVTTNTLVYDMDSMGGQSGAPVYIKRDGQRYVVGIHNYGASTGNSATRVTLSVFQRLLAWSKI